MPIIAKKPQSSFDPCPEGLHQAVCVDVVDLGLQNTPWGDKPKVEIRWQVDEVNPRNGRRFELRKRYGLSLHEKATLRKDLECWRGRKFTEAELEGFDLEKLLGKNCQLQVIHNLSDEGKTFDNVQALVPANSKVPQIAPQDYVRQKDRAKAQGNGHTESFDSVTEEDSSVPF
jgi:hypothetical protein